MFPSFTIIRGLKKGIIESHSLEGKKFVIW